MTSPAAASLPRSSTKPLLFSPSAPLALSSSSLDSRCAMRSFTALRSWACNATEAPPTSSAMLRASRRKREIFMGGGSGFGRRRGDGRGFLVEITKEIVERFVDLDVDVDRDVDRFHLDRLNLHGGAAGKGEQRGKQKERGAKSHGGKVASSTPKHNQCFVNAD